MSIQNKAVGGMWTRKWFDTIRFRQHSSLVGSIPNAETECLHEPTTFLPISQPLEQLSQLCSEHGIKSVQDLLSGELMDKTCSGHKS